MVRSKRAMGVWVLVAAAAAWGAVQLAIPPAGWWRAGSPTGPPQSAPLGPTVAEASYPVIAPAPQPMAAFVGKGLEWLVKAQHPDGGWGGGSHANQQNKDPHAVQVDPATTAFAVSALLRAGHTPTSGQYQSSVRKATEYLLAVVEKYATEGPRITDISGTQPQAKMGPLVDTFVTCQYFARVLPVLATADPLRQRVDAALAKCVKKLEQSQQANGSWNVGGGWAPVLQSSFGCNALELAQAAGKTVTAKNLDQARTWLKGNFDVASGKADSSSSASVELYAFSAAQRANASEARAADDVLTRAKTKGVVAADAPVSVDSLKRSGLAQPTAERLARSESANAAQIKRLSDESLLAGFGNNGGEEFLSYLLTSESMLIAGGAQWEQWNGKMHERLAKIQNSDGSWSGHHCITSPVFCTAAVVQCLTTDRDGPTLLQIAQNAAKTTTVAAVQPVSR